MTDVQNSINARPLTYRDSDVNNLEVICPNDFLKLGKSKSLVFGSLSGSEIEIPNHENLVSTLEKREKLFERYREIWYESYLLSLRESARDQYQDQWSDKIKEHDIVLIDSPIKSRYLWSLGRVTELLTGKDGKTRCVRVIKSDGTENVHSVNLLYPLEISLVSPPVRKPKDVQQKTSENQSKATKRPIRAAAEKCKQRLQECM